MRPMSLISPNFAVKLITFPKFGHGPFPKIAGKALRQDVDVKLHTNRDNNGLASPICHSAKSIIFESTFLN